MVAAQLSQSQKYSIGFDLPAMETGLVPPVYAFFLVSSAKSTRNKRPCPRYRKVAEHRGFRHFDSMRTSIREPLLRHSRHKRFG